MRKDKHIHICEGEAQLIVKKEYLDALLVLHRKLASMNINWAIGGDLGEALRTVEIEPDCVEIITNSNMVEEILKVLNEYNPEKPKVLEQRLDRDAAIGGKIYPIYVKSHYFDFNIGKAKVKVHGSLQFKVDDWEWVEPLEFQPEYVNVVGKRIPVVPLSLKSMLYQNLGWEDRVEKIRRSLPHPRKIPNL